MDEQEAAANVNAVSANTDVTAPAAPVEEAAAPAAETAETPVVPAAETAVAEDAPAAPAEEVKEEVKEERHEHFHKPVTPDMLERTQKDLMKMLDFLGYDDAVVKPQEENGDIMLFVESEDAGRIIGRKGQTLESIQLLLNRMVQKEDPEYPRILICIDGYASRFAHGHGGRTRPAGEEGEERPRHERRERRGGDRREHRGGDRGPRHERHDRRHSEGEFDENEDNLRQQALDAAKEVRHWGDPKTLPLMNSHDRRIIHITLEKEEDLQTVSEGDGPLKSITISLKK